MQAIGESPAAQDVVADLVRDQLRLIVPEVVVMGLSWNGLRERLFPKIEWQPCGYDIPIGKWEGIKLIDFCHPSARNAPAASYCLLQKVIESKAYGVL